MTTTTGNHPQNSPRNLCCWCQLVRVVSQFTLPQAACTLVRFGMKAGGTPELFNSAQTAERHEITNGTALKRTQKNPQFVLQEGQGEL